MASFVLRTGVQPSEYKQLTRLEREAFRTESQILADELRSRR